MKPYSALLLLIGSCLAYGKCRRRFERAKHHHLLAALVFALCTGPAWAKEPIRVLEGVVFKVSDGDTVQMQDALGTR